MGLADRHYAREEPRWSPGGAPSSGFTRIKMWSVTKWLLVINIAVFVLNELLPRYVSGHTGLPNEASWLFHWGHFSTRLGFANLEVWRLVTFQFLHAGILHLVFNMVGLYFFGPIVEQYLGRKRYAAFYLSCGIAGGLMYLVLNLAGWGLKLQIPGALFSSGATPLIGASAGVFGVIMACAFIAPKSTVRLLFPPIPMQMRTFAYAFTGIAAVSLLMGTRNAGGEAAHLGGAIAGFFLIRNPHVLRDFFDVLGNSNLPTRSGRRGQRQQQPGAKEQEVDRVLAKVREHGLHSLTSREKKILRQATEARRE